jgi:hypothetical protein
MRSDLIRMAAATALGVAAITASTAAGAADFVVVHDDEGYAPRRYVQDGRGYRAPPGYAYRAPGAGTRVIVRPGGEREVVYLDPDGRPYDGCTYKRERGLFGGWHEERDCP